MKRSIFRSLSGLSLLLCLLAACSSDEPSTGSGNAGDGNTNEGVTYHNSVRPLLEANCVSCHTAGGIGPFALDNWTSVEEVGELVVEMVETRQMPPWMPDPACRTFEHQRLLSEDEIQAFVDWEANGRPEGDPGAYSPLELPDTALPDGEPSLTVAPAEAYTPSMERPDDHRCLALDHTFEDDTFVTAIDIEPGVRSIVHHVLLYLVPEGDIADLESTDAGEEGPGYTCYGGPNVGSFETLGGWVPGSVPLVTPTDTALMIPAGSRVVMQVHYNVANLEVGEEPPADLSSVKLWTLPEGQYPERLINIALYANFGISIPAGDQRSVHEMDFTVPADSQLIGLAPHMHTLGEFIGVDLIRSGQEAEECLIEIPRWDFNWQQFYAFPEDQFLDINAGDTIRLRCEYDNSAANQPIVNGERLEPRDVTFGESTFDEMCLAFLSTTSPFYPGETGVCAGFEPCSEACVEGDSQCGLSCTFQSGQDCAFCMLSGLNDCARDHCQPTVAPLLTCFGQCDDYMGCLRETCAEQYDAVYDCLEPHIEAGECDQSLTACDVAYAQ